MTVSPLSISLPALDRWLGETSTGLPQPDELPEGLVPGLTPPDLITDLAAHALGTSLGEIEWLESVPVRDDLQFEGRPMPDLSQLHAWLYAPDRRVACAVHTPGWQSRGGARQNWDALLREHIHSGQGWTAISAVAMPLRVPFDEPGLKIWPLLALRAPVSPGEHWLNQTRTTSIRHGSPDVVTVQVFSAALYVRTLLAAGQDSVDIVPQLHSVSVRG